MLAYVATIRRLVFFFLLSLLAGCGAEEANGPAKEAPEKEETPPVPVALRLVAEGEFLVGETIQLHPSLIMGDGSENGPWAGRAMPLEQMARFPDIDWHPL